MAIAVALVSCGGEPEEAIAPPPPPADEDLLVSNYARTLLEIEPQREAVYNIIRQEMDGEAVPVVSCDRPETLKEVPRSQRETVVNYCNAAKAIVERNDLSVEEFNLLTQRLKADSDLRDRVQTELANLQGNAPATNE